MSLPCKLVPGQYRGYEYGLLNAIERSEIEQFNNRTQSNTTTIRNTSQFHPVGNKALWSKKLFIGFYFKHECNRQDVGQGRGETYHSGSGGKGLLRVLLRRPFVVKQKRGDKGPALRVTDDDRGQLGRLHFT